METEKFSIIDNGKEKNWITFVHGFTHDKSYFHDQANFFRDRYNILSVNLPGHGDRYKDEGPFNLYRYSFDILNTLNELNINRTLYWGTHTGAACGLLLAYESPSYIQGLILEGTPVPGLPIPSVKTHFQSTAAIYHSHGLERALDHWLHHSPWFTHMLRAGNPHIIDRHSTMLSRYKGTHFAVPVEEWDMNIIPRIKILNLPCLFYNGQYDSRDFKDAAAEIGRINPQVIVKLIENTGGFPSWENAVAVRSVVEAFLSHFKF